MRVDFIQKCIDGIKKIIDTQISKGKVFNFGIPFSEY